MSNYEITKNRVQQEFVKYDQKKMIEKFSLQHDEKYIYIEFLKRKYRIHRVEGIVEWIELTEVDEAKAEREKANRTKTEREKADEIKTDRTKAERARVDEIKTERTKVNQEEKDGSVWSEAQPANFNEVLTIFDVLCDSKDGCVASGEFVNMQSLSSIKGSTGNVGGSLFKTEGKLFDNHMEELARACVRLNGVKKDKGDVSYEIPIFDFLSFMIQFWESDDEFEASLEIFVDKNTLQFMRYETMWYAVSHMLDRIREECA